jgi:transcriptional regulator with XRE-family HTH domain
MNRIAELRKKRGLTQKMLGLMCEKSPYAVSKWESGTNEPSQEIIKFLCDVLGASAEYLMGHSEINTHVLELSVSDIPKNLRDAGLERVELLREYVDEHGGIHPDVQRELLRLIAEAKLLQDTDDPSQ